MKKLKAYEIWLGKYSLGQGYSDPTEPEKVATVGAVDFKTACLKFELTRKLERIHQGEVNGDLNNQDYPWWFDENTISNSWTGKYYESKEEAQKSFER